MKPDIVIKRKSDNDIFVLDTKWEILFDIKPNFGISQLDMYQMYAYQKKYIANKIILLYPLIEKVDSDKDIVFILNNGADISIKFVGLFDTSKRLTEILSSVQHTL